MTSTATDAAEETIEKKHVEACFEDDALDRDSYRQLQRVAVSSESNRKLFEQLTDAIDDSKSSVTAAKKGACLYVLGHLRDAEGTLKKAHPKEEIASVLLGQLYEDAEAFDKAKGVYAEAISKHANSKGAHFGLAKMHLLLGEEDAAKAQMDKAAKAFKDEPDLDFVQGFAAELSAEYEVARGHYERVVKSDPSHARALFRLGRYHATWGDEEQAVEYYERCCQQVPTYGNALINLGLLYEDLNRWDDACRCYETVLKAIPGHPRASMFLADAEASKSMFYDEERERRHDRQMAVLNIPVSDFELSVRSRNCLNKMNIKTLGDLMKMTEPELLAHKNFGETSLLEVKQMLAQKGLRLGQHRGQPGGFIGELRDTAPEVGEKEDVLKQSVNNLELSVRSRNCMNRLSIKTVGDLVQRSEQELLAAKNFGETSLNEIKSRLSELGLTLKGGR